MRRTSPFVFSSDSSDNEDNDSAQDAFFWGCTLTKSRPSIEWKFQDDGEGTHSLILKQAVLGVDATVDQRNVVSVETINYSKEKVHLPIISLTLGRNDMCSLDMCFESGDPVIFRLVDGSGPVHISAQHIVDYDDDDDSSDDSDIDVEVSFKKPVAPASRTHQITSTKLPPLAITRSSSVSAPPAAARPTSNAAGSTHTSATTAIYPQTRLPPRITIDSLVSSTSPSLIRGAAKTSRERTAVIGQSTKQAKVIEKPSKPRKPRATAKKATVSKQVVDSTVKTRAVRKPAAKSTAKKTTKSKSAKTAKGGAVDVPPDTSCRLARPKPKTAERRRSWAGSLDDAQQF